VKCARLVGSLFGYNVPCSRFTVLLFVCSLSGQPKPTLDRNERLERDLFGEVKAAPSNLENYEEIPVETSGNEVPRAIEAFTDAELHEVLLDNIKLAGYSRPTPVQKHAIPIAQVP